MIEIANDSIYTTALKYGLLSLIKDYERILQIESVNTEQLVEEVHCFITQRIDCGDLYFQECALLSEESKV